MGLEIRCLVPDLGLQVLYSPGVSPLALWLQPGMLQQTLGIPIPEIPPPLPTTPHVHQQEPAAAPTQGAAAAFADAEMNDAASGGGGGVDGGLGFVMAPSLLGSLGGQHTHHPGTAGTVPTNGALAHLQQAQQQHPAAMMQ